MLLHDPRKKVSITPLEYHIKKVCHAALTVAAYIGFVVYFVAAAYYLIPFIDLLVDRF